MDGCRANFGLPPERGGSGERIDWRVDEGGPRLLESRFGVCCSSEVAFEERSGVSVEPAIEYGQPLA